MNFSFFIFKSNLFCYGVNRRGNVDHFQLTQANGRKKKLSKDGWGKNENCITQLNLKQNGQSEAKTTQDLKLTFSCKGFDI